MWGSISSSASVSTVLENRSGVSSCVEGGGRGSGGRCVEGGGGMVTADKGLICREARTCIESRACNTSRILVAYFLDLSSG